MSKLSRAGWGLMAGLFFLTSGTLTVLAIWQSSHNNNQQQAPTTATKLAGTELSGFKPTPKIASLSTIDQQVGSGKAVVEGDSITVAYTGAVASSGIIFQSSLDSGQPVPLKLAKGQVIDGWVKGVAGMKTGGTRRILVPASLAYGASPPPGSGIPANADLVFDVTLLSIN